MGIRPCPKKEEIQKKIDEITKNSTPDNFKENLEIQFNNLFNREKKILNGKPCPSEKLPKCSQLEECPINRVFVSCPLLIATVNENSITEVLADVESIDTDAIECVAEPFCISNSPPIKTPCGKIDTSVVYAVRAIGNPTMRGRADVTFNSPFCQKATYTVETVLSIDQIVNLSLDPNAGCPEITAFFPLNIGAVDCGNTRFLNFVGFVILVFGPLA